MRKALKWTALAVGVLLLGAFGVLTYLAGSPKDAYGMVRYALPQMRGGELKVGDAAPDVDLLGLDGQSRFRLRERLGDRPLVLVFGSYT